MNPRGSEKVKRSQIRSGRAQKRSSGVRGGHGVVRNGHAGFDEVRRGQAGSDEVGRGPTRSGRATRGQEGSNEFARGQRAPRGARRGVTRAAGKFTDVYGCLRMFKDD